MRNVFAALIIVVAGVICVNLFGKDFFLNPQTPRAVEGTIRR